MPWVCPSESNTSVICTTKEMINPVYSACIPSLWLRCCCVRTDDPVPLCAPAGTAVPDAVPISEGPPLPQFGVLPGEKPA